MTDMKTYKATFRSGPRFNELPKAQTLFGAFCTIIKETKGQESLNDYLESLRENPWFVHSDVLPDKFFPAPKQPVFSLEYIQGVIRNTKPSVQLEVLNDYKKYKKIRFVSEGILRKYFLKGSIGDLRRDLMQHADSFLYDNGCLSLKKELLKAYSPKTAMQIKVSGLDDQGDNELYYVAEQYPEKDQRYCIYFKTDGGGQLLKEILPYLNYFGVGSKKSSGMNQLIFESLEEVDLKTKNDLRYLLSGCIPAQEDQIDYAESAYEIRSSLYRSSKTYNGGYWSGRYTHLMTGSMIHTLVDKPYYGRMEKSISQGKEVDHYGLGLVF